MVLKYDRMSELTAELDIDDIPEESEIQRDTDERNR